MFSWLGSRSKNWTRGKLKDSPNGVKSIVFLSHLNSTSLPLSSQYSLCLSHLSSTSLSHLNKPAQPLPLFAHAVGGLVSNFVVSSPPFKGFFSAPRDFRHRWSALRGPPLLVWAVCLSYRVGFVSIDCLCLCMVEVLASKIRFWVWGFGDWWPLSWPYVVDVGVLFLLGCFAGLILRCFDIY